MEFVGLFSVLHSVFALLESTGNVMYNVLFSTTGDVVIYLESTSSGLFGDLALDFILNMLTEFHLIDVMMIELFTGAGVLVLVFLFLFKIIADIIV